MVKNLSVAVLDLCFLKHVKELPWEGFLPYQGLSGISIDLDTMGLEKTMDQICVFDSFATFCPQ